MNKYLTLYGLSWQKQLETRSDFFFERTRSISILVSLYFLWWGLLAERPGALGYSRSQLITYVFMMTILRALVLACVTERIPMEIAKGKLSEILLRPISHLGYWAAQDAASKTLNLISAAAELTLFVALVRPPFFVPASAAVWAGFAASAAGAMVLYFLMSYLLGVLGFWTAQSWGPRFCFEILLEFCAGAYFPIDVLPRAAQSILSAFPFPYLIFYPVSIYLQRGGPGLIRSCLLHQAFWIGALAILGRFLWSRGMRRYAAEGR